MSQSKLWESDERDALFSRRAKVKGDFKDIGWSSIVDIVCGFEAVQDLNKEIRFGVALKNNLPIQLPVFGISVHFLEHRGQSRMIRFEDAHSIALKTDQWREFITPFVPTVHGEVRAEFIEIRFGQHASLTWHLRLSNRPNVEQGNEDDHREHQLFKGSLIQPGLHSVRIKHVGPSPKLTVTGPSDVYLGEEIVIGLEVDCEGSFEAECLRLDLSCDNSMGNPRWTSNQTSVFESVDVSLESDNPWKMQLPILVDSFGVVTVRATLKLNFEAVITHCLAFEVKEPFQVDARVLSPPATYLFLPPPMPSSSPLSMKQSGVMTTNTMTIAEGMDAYVQLTVKCKADCTLTLTDAVYKMPTDVAMQVSVISGNANAVTLGSGDVHSMIYRLKPIGTFVKQPCSLALKWKRTSPGPLHQVSGSLLDRATSLDADGQLPSSGALTVCRLHILSTQKVALSARLQPPEEITAGIPFPYFLHLSNHTTFPEEFEISLMDAAGCLFAGDRTNRVRMGPLEKSKLKWQCVAYNSGNVQLPSMTVSSTRAHAYVEMAGIDMFAFPPGEKRNQF